MTGAVPVRTLVVPRAGELEIVESVTHDAVRLETKAPQSYGRTSHEIRYFVKVPKSIKVEARTTNGAAIDPQTRAREAIAKAVAVRDKVTPRERLYIEAQGASQDPDRDERPARSLRGAKAGRIVRAASWRCMCSK